MSGNAQSAGQSAYTCAPMAKVVVFSLEDQRYALPLHSVERVLPMVWVSALPKAPAIVVGVINMHGRVLPVLDIRCRFGLPPREWGPEAQLIVVQLSRCSVALPVDEVVGVSEVSVSAAPPARLLQSGLRHLTGIVSLADGLLFVCNLESFLSLTEEHQLASALEEARP